LRVPKASQAKERGKISARAKTAPPFINKNAIVVKFGSDCFEDLPAPPAEDLSIGYRFNRRPYCLLDMNDHRRPL
jgi:hypothetical protein